MVTYIYFSFTLSNYQQKLVFLAVKFHGKLKISSGFSCYSYIYMLVSKFWVFVKSELFNYVMYLWVSTCGLLPVCIMHNIRACTLRFCLYTFLCNRSAQAPVLFTTYFIRCSVTFPPWGCSRQLKNSSPLHLRHRLWLVEIMGNPLPGH